MDKKSIFLGIVFMAAGLLLMTYNGIQESKARQERLLEEAARNEAALQAQAAGQDPEAAAAEPPAFVASEPIVPLARTADEEAIVSTAARAAETLKVLENATLRVTLSSHSGGIESVELKQYPRNNPHTDPDSPPVILNKVSNGDALALTRALGRDLAPLAPQYLIETADAEHVVFAADLGGGLRVRRTYSLLSGNADGPAPYTIRHQTEFINNSDAALTLNPVFLNLGTAAPTDADYMGFNLNASFFNNGDYGAIAAKKFQPGGFLRRSTPPDQLRREGILQWGAVKNQFFTAIFTPDAAADALVARGVKFPIDPNKGTTPIGVTADLEFAIPTIAPGSVQVISGDYYAGPKAFDRLSQMQLKQEDVMQLGWFLGMFLGFISFVAKALLTLLSFNFGFLGNWGFAIILTTIIIRLFLWPLTAKAARASKRMQKLQKPIKELQEKYRDNPTKMQQEMMGLWKKHKINPLSGCWPVLVQFPIFIAFFNLLRNSSDLRFAEFLWIKDLSMPDATIPLGSEGLPLLGTALNVLPFIWLVSMYFQMRMMPQPSVDNAQAKIIKWMPFIFFPFTYYFSSGLVLYWTATNCFSIFQQWMTNRSRDEEDVAIESEIAEMESKKQRKAPSGPLITRKKRKKGGAA